MVQQQDSTDPTGVAVVTGDRVTKSVARSRDRKAAAALEMILSGYTWTEVCISVGYPTERAAKVAVELTLEKRLNDQDREYLRTLAGARLDSLLKVAWRKAHDDDHPDQLAWWGKAQSAVADFRKLHGLDAPTEVNIYNPTQAELEEWVAAQVATGGAIVDIDEDDIVEADVVEDDDALQAG